MRAPRLDSQTRQTLPIATAFTLSALIIYHYHLKESSIALILGIIAGGLVEMDHRASGRIKNLLFILACYTLSAIITQIALLHPIALTLLMTSLAFGMTLLGALDNRYRIIAFCTLAVAVYTILTYQPELAWYTNPLMLILGTLIIQGTALAYHLIAPNLPVQESLASSFNQLSQYIHIKARYFAPDERDNLAQAEKELSSRNRSITDAFNHTRDTLFTRLTNNPDPRRQRQLNDFFIAQDIHERISAAHVDYQDLTAALEHSDLLFRIERLITLQGRTCREYAQALQNETPYQLPDTLSRAEAGIRQSRAYHQAKDGITPHSADINHIIANLATINRRLANLGQSQYTPRDSSLANSNLNTIRDIPARLKSHLTPTSSIYRHAIRLAAISLISCLIVESLHLKLGYWILLTAVFIIQPNRNATRARLTQRIIGTLIGVIIGSLLPHLAPDRSSLLSLIVISNTLFFYFRLKNYSLSTLFITVQVFLSFSLIGMDTTSAMGNRILDTLIGAGLAWLAVKYLLPDERYLNLSSTTHHALQADAAYLEQIAAQLSSGTQDDISYRIARRCAHESAGQLAQLASELNSTQADTLTQSNYRLIAQLSTLGTHRGSLAAEDSNSQTILQTIADLEQLLTRADSLDPDSYSRTLAHIQSTLTPLEKHPPTAAIAAALNRITALLPNIRQNLIQTTRHANTP